MGFQRSLVSTLHLTTGVTGLQTHAAAPSLLESHACMASSLTTERFPKPGLFALQVSQLSGRPVVSGSAALDVEQVLA